MSTIHIGAVYLCCHAPVKRGWFHWHVGPIRHKEMSMPLELTMSNEEKALVHALPKSAAGNPDVVQGDVLYEVLSGDCTIGDRVDAMSVWVMSGPLAGDSMIRVSADADLGEGVVTIEDMLTVHVTDALATSLELSADVPVLK